MVQDKERAAERPLGDRQIGPEAGQGDDGRAKGEL